MIASTNDGASDEAMIHDDSPIETVIALTAIVLARVVNPIPFRWSSTGGPSTGWLVSQWSKRSEERAKKKEEPDLTPQREPA